MVMYRPLKMRHSHAVRNIIILLKYVSNPGAYILDTYIVEICIKRGGLAECILGSYIKIKCNLLRMVSIYTNETTHYTFCDKSKYRTCRALKSMLTIHIIRNLHATRYMVQY